MSGPMTTPTAEYRAFMRACAGSEAVRALWAQEAPAAEAALLDDHLRPGRVLLAGCGHGREIPGLLARGCRVLAVDREPDMCQVVRARFADPRLEVVEADLSALPDRLAPIGFSSILCLGLVSGGLFLPDGGALRALRGLGQCLAPGGVLLLDFLAAAGGPETVRVARFEYPTEAGPLAGLCAWPSVAAVRKTLFAAGLRCTLVTLLHDPATPLLAAVATRP